MRDSVEWEWDVEILNEYGDIEDHHFQTSFRDCVLEDNGDESYFEIVLVRSAGNDDDGVTDRSWAYLDEDGNIPEYTSTPDSEGQYVNQCHKVPKRFHAEVVKFKRQFNAREFWRKAVYRNYPTLDMND